MSKTGSGGRPWVDLERPKPPKVADTYAYWMEQPPTQSERCLYWQRQIGRGWSPNRSVGSLGYDTKAHWFGVYMWEYLNVLYPMLRGIPDTPGP